MKFGMAKLPQSFYKDTEKNFKRKKSNKELSLIDDRKVMQIFVTIENFFFTFQIKCRCIRWGHGEPWPPILVY